MSWCYIWKCKSTRDQGQTGQGDIRYLNSLKWVLETWGRMRTPSSSLQVYQVWYVAMSESLHSDRLFLSWKCEEIVKRSDKWVIGLIRIKNEILELIKMMALQNLRTGNSSGNRKSIRFFINLGREHQRKRKLLRLFWSVRDDLTSY